MFPWSATCTNCAFAVFCRLYRRQHSSFCTRRHAHPPSSTDLTTMIDYAISEPSWSGCREQTHQSRHIQTSKRVLGCYQPRSAFQLELQYSRQYSRQHSSPQIPRQKTSAPISKRVIQLLAHLPRGLHSAGTGAVVLSFVIRFSHVSAIVSATQRYTMQRVRTEETSFLRHNIAPRRRAQDQPWHRP